MEAATQKTEETEEAVEAAPAGPPPPPPRLRERYEKEVVPALQKRFGYSSPMAVPRLLKVTVNMGVGEAARTKGLIEDAQEELATISGQYANIRLSKKSIANFKIREEMPVGCAVTLRRARMWEFLDRLITIATPRVRDFRGYNPRSFDGRGNFTLGIKEQIIFPEIDYDSVKEVRGLDVAVTTSAQSDEEAFELLLGLGFPFAQDGRPGAGPTEEELAEEERRAEEARIKAEAEQAALEQLKEENPEAYAKPEPEDEEGAEDGESDGEGAGDGESKKSSGEEEE